MTDALSANGATVRQHDPDRFLCALFAPPERREALFTLYAFNHELARAREVTSEPTLALIRLQWWREVVEGAARRHEVATPLSALLAEGALDRADLLAMIEGREMETDPAIPTTADFMVYARQSGGHLAVAAGALLGADCAGREWLVALGTGYAMAGVLRRVPALAREGRCLLPEDMLAAQGLCVHDAIARPDAADLGGLIGTARAMLADRHAWPRPVIAAALPAVLARRDLAHGLAPRPRGIGDRLAVLGAYVRGRA